ncbi:putative RNA-directed DNA polymerase [Helianthus annuus]|nr:putative RNA-directed DNA polymerase [Helianthus annuus]
MCWNIRGLNHPLKQAEVRNLMSVNNVELCAILESHVDVSKLDKVCKYVFRKWNWTSNGGVCSRGTRIILGWNADNLDVMVLFQTDQIIHTQIFFKASKKVLFCSFVYAENKYQDRRLLWNELCKQKVFCVDKPWVVMGDFNSALNLEDSLYGSSKQSIGMREFDECVHQADLIDINAHGSQYTWNQKPKSGAGLLKKIDRIMGNVTFIDQYPSAYAMFHPFRVSDHTPCFLKMLSNNGYRPRPFKFPNFIVTKPAFKDSVKSEWEKNVEGVTMLSVVKKLRNLKPKLRKILFDQGNLHVKVNDLRKKLDDIHVQVDQNPLDSHLRQLEAQCLQEFQSAAYDEECFLKQKSKVEWLCAGDSNTKFFHNTVKVKNARTKIYSVMDSLGNRYEGEDVADAMVSHYMNFLGIEIPVQRLNSENLFTNVLSSDVADRMIRQVTREEVKQAMFSIGEDKAPGPDGYTSAFFKHAWDVVGNEVTNVVLQFFENGKLLNQVNHTILALIPKKEVPDSVVDYRPISCCNVLYKCISKILTYRLKPCLGVLVSINQSAFVLGRKISDNILLTQELMHNYHLNRGPARCAFKIDIQKAYGTVNWDFLELILTRFGFHQKMVKWIMTCVTTVSYSVSINGNLHGYFKGKRGLRQGDPMSPYLFTLIMEVLSLLLRQAANNSYKYHALCAKEKIINVSFADDLFIFVHGDVVSVRKIKKALEIFTNISELAPSPAKSTVFFCNVPPSIRQEILDIIPFQEGSLPVRYLGVPLISSRLLYKDCEVLIQRMEKKIVNWVTKSLSFAGRLQLINSVLSSMHIYWASVFVIPARVISELEKRIRRFLWNAGSDGRIRAKVAWKDVCLPKDEGGLGIRNISDVNKSLMANHIWSIISNRESIWVRWIHNYKLKGRSLWEVPCRGSMSWGWRKILSIRSIIRPHIWSSLKSGLQTNVWSDMWCTGSPLRSFITPRYITNAGFNLRTTVAEIIDQNGNWKWPQAWFDLFPVLITILVPNLDSNAVDRLVWKDLDGKTGDFKSAQVWNTIRSREHHALWANMVWFSQCIPRHAFHMWLAFRNKLKTQDRMAIWEAGSQTNMNLMCCPLCNYDRDSRDHLFFQCNFSAQVWNKVKAMVNLTNVDTTWSSILTWGEQHSRSKNVDHIVCKLVIAAASYYIWQERNNRLFNNSKRSVDQVSEKVKGSVRLRLMGFRFRVSSARERIFKAWQIEDCNYDVVDPG